MRRIVVDAMGGRHAPLEAVRGAARASLSLPDSEIILVGDAAEIGGILPECRHDGSRVRVQHAAQVIEADEDPALASKEKPEASLLIAAKMLANGEADALVSAGNASVLVSECAELLTQIPGISSAALAAVFPTELRRGDKNDPFSLILDVGAGADASMEELLAFANMGSAYATIVSENPRPRIALLSGGSALCKGPPALIEADRRLQESDEIHYVGTIEGIDIPRGVADVIICSGMVGNVVVEMLQGVAHTVMNLARYAYKDRLMWRAALSLLSTGLGKLKEVTDWEQYAGAPLLGYEQVVISAHDGAKEKSIANAIRVADKSVRGGLCQRIATKASAGTSAGGN